MRVIFRRRQRPSPQFAMDKRELQNRRRGAGAAAIEAGPSRCVLTPMGQELMANGIAAGIPLFAPAVAPRPAWLLFSERRRWGLLAILFLVLTSNYVDRNVIAVLLEPIKQEFRVSDTALGLLGGFCFAAFYVAFGMPVPAGPTAATGAPSLRWR